ncbi:unnamed protein product [Thlaspi arvense]|uniref:Histone-binding protein RBBP4-like N-terminal domain-containing protein n=1 Tax=Thlaspi arvense TaxID=13288 RepID=A0AAU9RTY0_THLAR|nr:unnamed protein product [Thlaspi arvense]
MDRRRNPRKPKRKNKNKGDASSSSIPSIPTRVWQPGVDKLEDGEELQCDPSAYNSLHGFHVGWPCLSFDILSDKLGLNRTEFPHTLYMVAGTQAEKAPHNSIGMFKISNVSGKRRDVVPKTVVNGDDMEEDDDADDNSDSDESEDEASRLLTMDVLTVYVQCHKTLISASLGEILVWDMSSHLNALAESETEGKDGTSPVLNQAPLVSYSGHKNEGYAIDWSPATAGRLLSGDCDSRIHLWEPASGTWAVDPVPFAGHTNSVEDLQWSPAEANVFASCSVDGTVAVWDVRVGKSPALAFKAHKTDVNVISWNRLASCMLASGSDDGSFSIRDLRLIKDGDAVIAHFEYHKHPITSIEWSAHEASTLAVSSGDNQLTIWDLSLEKDEEEEEEFKAQTKEQVNAPQDLPPQLLFVHQGQKDLKELHWHNQIPGMIISTAADGFNILMPYNIQNTLPDLAA